MASIKFAQLGQGTLDLTVEDGATVEVTLQERGVDTTGINVRVNGAPAELDTPLEDGDVLVTSRNIRGGSL